MPSPSAAIAIPRCDLGGAVEQIDLEAQNRGYIAQVVLPIFSTPTNTGTYPVIPIAQLLQNRNLLRSPRSGYSRGSITFSEEAFCTTEYGIEEPIDAKETRLYRNYFDLELIATKRAVNAVLGSAEHRMVTALTDPAVITQTGAALAPWSDPIAAAPLDDFATARYIVWSSTGIWVNAVVMSKRTFLNLRDCLQVIDRIRNNSNYRVLAGEMTPEMMASAFDVERVIISDAAKNAAREGQPLSVASAWPDSKVLVAKLATSNDLREPCLGRTFHWAEDGSQPLGTIETYRDEQVRAEIVRVRHEVQEKVTYPKAGYLITAV
ncbi:MAG: hypothetical protein V4719_04170 [Planctomycetota bacterium]